MSWYGCKLLVTRYGDILTFEKAKLQLSENLGNSIDSNIYVLRRVDVTRKF